MKRLLTVITAVVLAGAGLVAGAAGANAADPGVDAMVEGAGGVVWSVAFAPDGRFFYSVRQTGEIYAGKYGTGPVHLITLPSCPDCGEGGLMGLATSPGFANDGLLYAMYTYRSGGAIGNRVVRLKVGATGATVDRTVLDGIRGGTTHQGGRLRFGPDGMLYATIGDGRITPNPAQDKTVLAGKILRLDPDGGAAAGNPYGNAVWSYGHRNPQGLDFRADGQLFALEHGPDCRDELNRIVKGGNYGWTGNEGCPPPFPAGSIQPIATLYDDRTIAPSGASFYTGNGIPAWTGSLFFTTLKDATLYRFRLAADGQSVTEREQLFRGTFGRIRDVEQAPDGSLWLTTDDGRVLRIRGTQSTQPASPKPSPSPSAASPMPSASSGPCAVPARVELATGTIDASTAAPATVVGTPGARVDVQAYTQPSTSDRVVRSVQLDNTGRAAIRLVPPANTRLYAQESGCAAGPSVVLNVRSTLTLFAKRNGTRDYTYTGDSLPARSGGLIVSLYRVQADGMRVLTAQTRADAGNGEWRIDRRFTGTGRFGFVLLTGQDLQNAPGTSRTRPTEVF